MDIREKLKSRFPEGYSGFIYCKSGWDWILEDLERKLTYLDPDYELYQVKEKFGTLRFYYGIHGDKIIQDIARDIVRIAEQESASTCETCGSSSRIATDTVKYDKTVKLRTKNWWATRCDTCCKIKDR